MINWFNMPAEGLSNGGQFEIKELTATENRTYEKDGEVYNKVTVNVSGGGSSDFSTAEVTIINNSESNQFFSFISLPDNEEGQIANNFSVNSGETKKVFAVLYKNNPADGKMDSYEEDFQMSFSGNIADDGDGFFIISGPGTITISSNLN